MFCKNINKKERYVTMIKFSQAPGTIQKAAATMAQNIKAGKFVPQSTPHNKINSLLPNKNNITDTFSKKADFAQIGPDKPPITQNLPRESQADSHYSLRDIMPEGLPDRTFQSPCEIAPKLAFSMPAEMSTPKTVSNFSHKGLVPEGARGHKMRSAIDITPIKMPASNLSELAAKFKEILHKTDDIGK